MGKRDAAPRALAGASFLDGVAFFAAGVLVIAVPLVWDGGVPEMFRGPKSELAFLAWAALAAVFLTGNPGGAAWHDPWWLAWGGLLAGGAVSGLFSQESGRALVALAPVAVAGAGWGALRQLPERRRGTLAALVVWAGVIEAAAALLFLRASWRPASFALLGRTAGRYSWLGTLGNPADVAVFLVLPALLAADRALASPRLRLSNGAAALLMGAVILGTRTMTAVLALTAGALVLGWTRVPRRRRLGAVAAVVVVVLVLFLATPLARRVRSSIRETEAGGLLWLGSARFAAYAAGVSMLEARPVTGVGFDLYEANSFRFQTADALAERGRVLGLETGFGQAHNDLLQYAAETGLVGLVLAGAGIAWAVRRRPRGGGAVAALPLAAAALALALTQFPLHLAATAAQWLVLSALVLPPLPPAPDTERRHVRLRLLVAGLLIGATLVLVWRHHRASALVQQAKELSATLRASSEAPPRRQEIARVALANLAPTLRWLPYSWDAALTVGNLAIDAGETEVALASFERARALAERPEVEFDVGIALLLAGDREGALAHLVRAVHLNPAIFREVRNPDLSRALRRRLDADGYGTRHSWMYQGTPAAAP